MFIRDLAGPSFSRARADITAQKMLDTLTGAVLVKQGPERSVPVPGLDRSFAVVVGVAGVCPMAGGP